MNKGGFSWKRASGATKAKQKISKATGIPLTKSGRQRKAGKIVAGGCLTYMIVIMLLISMAVTVFAHPGRLDKNGGHNVNAAGWGYPVGSYHYHYGSDRDTAYDSSGNVIPKNSTSQTQQSATAATTPTEKNDTASSTAATKTASMATKTYEWEKYYKTDNYSKYTTPASENKLNGTLLTIQGSVKEIYKYDNNDAYVISSKNNEQWLISIDAKEYGKTNIMVGDSVIVYGVYLGIAQSLDDMPIIYLLRLVRNGNIYQPSSQYVPIATVYEGRSFEDTHMALSETVDMHYKEFPNIPSFGYIVNTEPIKIYQEDDVYVYQYDWSKFDSDDIGELAYKYGEKLAEAGFNDYEVIENGLIFHSPDIVIIYRYNDSSLFSFTVGKVQNKTTHYLKTPTEISVKVDGEKIKFDQLPEMVNENIMIPISYVAKNMSCNVVWDNATKTVYINDYRTPINKSAIKTDNINVYVNNKIITFENQQPINKNGTIFTSLSPIAEKLGYKYEWVEDLMTVYINEVTE